MGYCEGCFEKQLKIEQLQEEITQLKAKLRYRGKKRQGRVFRIFHTVLKNSCKREYPGERKQTKRSPSGA